MFALLYYFLQVFLLIKKQIIDSGAEREKPVLLLIKPFTLERSKIPELSDQKIFFPPKVTDTKQNLKSYRINLASHKEITDEMIIGDPTETIL